MFNSKHFVQYLILLLSFLLLAGCSATDELNQGVNKKPIVAVSIVPEETFVKAVCGDLVEVVTLIPPGNSPENYEPTPAEIEKFSQASLYFAIGVPTEKDNLLPLAAESTDVVNLHFEVSYVYPELKFESGERDPHIWLSPKRVKVMIDIIAINMGEFDPQNKDTYLANAAEYNAQLDDLNQNILTALANVKNRKFIVFHPAFGYYADDYNLEMYALESEGKESTARHLQQTIDLAKENDIKIIFYQDEIDSNQSDAFAEEIGGKTMALSPLSADYIDNLRGMANLMAEVMK